MRWHIAGFGRFHTEHMVVLTALRQAALVNPEFAAQVEALTTDDIGHIRDHLDYILSAGRTLPAQPDLVLAMFSVGPAPCWVQVICRSLVREVAMSTVPSPLEPGSQERPREDPGTASVSEPRDRRIGPQPPMPDFEPDGGLPGDPALGLEIRPRRPHTDPA